MDGGSFDLGRAVFAPRSVALVGLSDNPSRPTARAMVEEVRGPAPIRGHRGMACGDLDALARAIVAFSSLATHQRTVLEAEANPVMVRSDGAVAVDALVTLAEEDAP